MDTSDVIQNIAMVGGMVFSVWLVITYLMKQVEKEREERQANDDEIRKEFQARSDDIHSRVNDVKDNYARRDDLLLHMETIEKSQTKLLDQMERQHRNLTGAVERVHARLDLRFAALPDMNEPPKGTVK